LAWGEARVLQQSQALGSLAAQVLGAQQFGEQAELARSGALDGGFEHASGQRQVAGEFHDLLDGRFAHGSPASGATYRFLRRVGHAFVSFMNRS
jgi:hypothetical protein